MRTLRHPIVMFVVTVLAVIGIGVGVLAQATPGQHRPLVVSAICAQGYHSLSDIARASMEVVTVSVQPQPRLVTVAGIPFTLTDVRVISSLKGSLSSGDVVSIRELGPRGTAEPEPSPSAGSTELLFLLPFEWVPGSVVAGQYVPLGCGQGMYEQSASDANTFDAMSQLPGLPESMTVQDVQAAVTS